MNSAWSKRFGPTRECHLLDFVVTDMPSVKTRILPANSDHKLVLAEMQFKVPEQCNTERMAWVYKKPIGKRCVKN